MVVKRPVPNGTRVSGSMDLNLRNPSCLMLSHIQMAVVVKTVLGSHFRVGEFTTHFRTYFSGDWDVHWGYDMDIDPWPKSHHETKPWLSPFLSVLTGESYHSGFLRWRRISSIHSRCPLWLFWLKITGDSWLTDWLFHNLQGPSFFPKGNLCFGSFKFF